METKLQMEKDLLIQKIRDHLNHHETNNLALKRFEQSGDIEGIIRYAEALKTVAYANFLMKEPTS